MLVELRLENYAVIDNVAVKFASGLNLLTGETGAGKSILIDALALLLGEKASSDVIRTGAEKAVVSAVFELDAGAEKSVGIVLQENGIDSNEDSAAVILRREIAPAGKGRVFVNNQPATVSVLKRLANSLATIHAQNETLLSFDASSRLHLLDSFAGCQIEPAATAFANWKGIRRQIDDLERDEQDRLRLLDLWAFQKREIEEAALEDGEDEVLATEKRVLGNAEKIYTAAMNAFDLLYDGASSTSSTLRAAAKHVEELSRYEPRFKESLAALEAARIAIEDVGVTVRDYGGGIQASPERLAEVEDRLALIDRLKRKYGATLVEVIEFGAEAARKVGEVENRDELLASLRKQLTVAAEQYLQAGRSLSRKRKDAARKLEKLVESEINELAMKVAFQIEVSTSEDPSRWTASGFDEVNYMISTNPGEPMRRLEHIASGGELSRVMLALKSSVETGSAKSASLPLSRNKRAGQRTMIFDEIDTGIGGRAAESVGKKLKSLAKFTQVLCVTHLPQIATFADHHYLLEKKQSAGRTKTTVRLLEGIERTEEVARMLSGAKLTEASLRHAEQMIKSNA